MSCVETSLLAGSRPGSGAAPALASPRTAGRGVQNGRVTFDQFGVKHISGFSAAKEHLTSVQYFVNLTFVLFRYVDMSP